MRGRKRRNDIDSSEFDNVVSLYKNKISLKQIAFDYDVTTYVVRGVLVGMGVEIGPRGRPWVQPKHPMDEQLEKELKHVEDTVDLFEGFDYKAVRDSVIQEDDNLLALGDFRRPLGE